MLEKSIVAAIKKRVVESGGKVYKLHGTAYAVAGAPDLIGSYHGRAFAVEVKQPGRGPTVLQARELAEWQKQGWVVGVAHSADEFERLCLPNMGPPPLGTGKGSRPRDPLDRQKVRPKSDESEV